MKHALAAGLWGVWIALAGSGCATDVRVDADPGADIASLRTWDWLEPSAVATSQARAADAGLEALLRVAIERELGERGYERVEDGRPDFRVACHVKLERELVHRVETPAMQTLSSHHRDGGFEVTASRRVAEIYETGTVVLVAVDGRRRQRIWRGIGVRRVREAFRTEADRVVAEILERFPAAAEARF